MSTELTYLSVLLTGGSQAHPGPFIGNKQNEYSEKERDNENAIS